MFFFHQKKKKKIKRVKILYNLMLQDMFSARACLWVALDAHFTNSLGCVLKPCVPT